MKNYLLLMLLIILFSGCEEKIDKKKIIEKNIFSYALSHKLTLAKYLIVIPNEGCPGCISTAQEFVKENYTNSHITIVFTAIMSQKIMRNRIDKGILESNNVIIDTTNLFINNLPEAIYPFWVHIQGNHIDNVFFQNPETSAFDDLKNELKKVKNEN